MPKRNKINFDPEALMHNDEFASLRVPPADVVGLLHLMLIGRTEWDERPEVGVMYSWRPGHLAHRPLPLPDAFWEYGRPAACLDKLRDVWADDTRSNHMLRRLTPEGFADGIVGVYFRCEIWSSSPKVAKEMLKLQRAGMDVPSIEHREGTREARAVQIYTIDGAACGYYQYRDAPHKLEAQFFTQVGGRDAPDDDAAIPSGGVVYGNIPDALADLFTLWRRIDRVPVSIP